MWHIHKQRICKECYPPACFKVCWHINGRFFYSQEQIETSYLQPFQVEHHISFIKKLRFLERVSLCGFEKIGLCTHMYLLFPFCCNCRREDNSRFWVTTSKKLPSRVLAAIAKFHHFTEIINIQKTVSIWLAFDIKSISLRYHITPSVPFR